MTNKKGVPVHSVEDVAAFEESVAAEQAMMLEQIEKGGKPVSNEIIPEAPAKPAPMPAGKVRIATVKQEVVDMAQDCLHQLHGKPAETEVVLQQGPIKLTGIVDLDGDIHLCWEGMTIIA